MSGRFDVGVSGSRTAARRGCWIVGSARRRASGFRSIARDGGRGACIASVTAGFTAEALSRASSGASTTSPGATPGRRRSFIRRSCWRRRSGAARHRRKRPRRPMPGMMLHQDRLASRLARRPAGARSDRDAGRRDEHDLFGVSGRGGRHGFDLPGAERDIQRARAADEPLLRTGAAITSTRRDQAARSTASRPDAGGPRARAARRRAYCGLFATGARAAPSARSSTSAGPAD